MNCQDLIKLLREYPESTEVLLHVDGEFVPVQVEHVQVVDGRVVLAPVAEPTKTRKKSK